MGLTGASTNGILHTDYLAAAVYGSRLKVNPIYKKGDLQSRLCAIPLLLPLLISAQKSTKDPAKILMRKGIPTKISKIFLRTWKSLVACVFLDTVRIVYTVQGRGHPCLRTAEDPR